MKIKPTSLYLLLLSVLLAIASVPSYSAESVPELQEITPPSNTFEQPNILILFAEDMSSHIGAFGDAVAVTPNLDQLALEGLRYTNTFATASTCGPSRAALLTGVHQIFTGSQHMRAIDRPAGSYMSVPPPEVKAFPELLRQAGYYTFTDGKLDYQFSGVLANSGPFSLWSDDSGNNNWQARAQGQPFFGLINFFATHESGSFPPLGNWPNSITHFITQLIHFFTDYSSGDGPVQPKDIALPPFYPDTPTVREDIARHYNNIYQIDIQLGKIISQLEIQGLLDTTVVIFVSDHGDGLPRAKRSLFDGGIKVPMIIRWPDRYRPDHLAPGQTDSRLISLIDLAPTFLKLSNVEIPDHIQGVSFLNTNNEREFIHASQDRVDNNYGRMRLIRTERYKYIKNWHPEQTLAFSSEFRNNLPMMREWYELYEKNQLTPAQQNFFEPIGEEQLYDIQQDPWELNNLANNSQYQSILTGFREQLEQWLAHHGDWSEEHEDQMVKRFMPDGRQQVTAVPVFSRASVLSKVAATHSSSTPSMQLRLSCQTEGASIAYKINDNPWQIYTHAFTVANNAKVLAKAVRYGWKESEEVEFDTLN